jgi:hypothetical protein
VEIDLQGMVNRSGLENTDAGIRRSESKVILYNLSGMILILLMLIFIEEFSGAKN